MSADPQVILEVISPGRGLVLDLGGGRGGLRDPLEGLGYRYVNIDIQGFSNGEPSLIGDVHVLPFKDASFDMVISKDSLEHFIRPWAVIGQVHRVLRDGERLLIWVPFMHPFHGDDLYRYSPLGLRHLLEAFQIERLDSPAWIFTIAGFAAAETLRRMRLGFAERAVRRACARLDRLFMSGRQRPASFAAGYRVVAQKCNGTAA